MFAYSHVYTVQPWADSHPLVGLTLIKYIVLNTVDHHTDRDSHHTFPLPLEAGSRPHQAFRLGVMIAQPVAHVETRRQFKLAGFLWWVSYVSSLLVPTIVSLPTDRKTAGKTSSQRVRDESRLRRVGINTPVKRGELGTSQASELQLLQLP